MSSKKANNKDDNSIVEEVNEPIYGAAPTSTSTSQVKFAYHNGETIPTSTDAGQLIFNTGLGHKSGAIVVGDQLVSSKILDITTEAGTDNKNLVVTYIDASDDNAIKTTTIALPQVIAGSGIALTTGDTKDSYTVAANVDGKTITAGSDNKLSTALSIDYVQATTDNPARIVLKDNAGTALSSVPVSSIVGNGYLHDSSYNSTTGILTLNFNNGVDSSVTPIEVNLAAMLDINDVLIDGNSQNYLTAKSGKTTKGDDIITLALNTGTVATGDDALTTAKDVKEYLNSSFGALAANASANTNYMKVGVNQENGLITGVTLDASVSNVTASAGIRGTYSVSDDGEVALSGEVTPSLAGTANSLLDGANAMTGVTTYVDAKVAAEAARADAHIQGAVKALDVTEATVGDEHVKVTYSETDGKVALNVSSSDIASAALLGTATDTSAAATAFGAIKKEAAEREAAIAAVNTSITSGLTTDEKTVSATNVSFKYKETNGIVDISTLKVDYATLTRTAHSDANKAALTVSNEAGLVTGNDISTLKAYVDDKATETAADAASSVANLKADITSDDAAVAKVEVSTEGGNVKDVVVTTIGAGVDTSVNGGVRNIAATTATGAVLGSDIATIKTYVDGKVGDVQAALNSTVTVTDASQYVTATVALTDGALDKAKSSLSYVHATYNTDTLTVGENGLVDGELANNIAKAVTTAAVNNLDVSSAAADSSANGTNVKVVVTETDGKIKVESVSETYATVTKSDASTLTTTNSAGLATGTDVQNAYEAAKGYADTKITSGLTWTVL